MIAIAIVLISQVSVELRNNVTFYSGNGKDRLGIQDQILFPEFEGFSIRKGFNFKNSVLVGIELGDEKIGTRIISEPFISYPPERESLYLHRFLSQFRYRFISVSGGRDTIQLGPGIHNSLLISHNIPPQDFVSFEIKELELPCLGDFCFGSIYLLTGLIFVNDRTHPFRNPKIIPMRFDWEIYFLKFGASRTIMFNGEGGYSPKSLRNYIDLFTAKYENATALCEGLDELEKRKCVDYWLSRDTNQMAEVFGVVNFSDLLNYFGVGYFDELRGYFEYGADDIITCWQVEDVSLKRCLPIPWSFTDVAWIVGLIGRTRKFGFVAEYTWTNKIRPFYDHHGYPMRVLEYYTGEHAGPFSDDLWVKFIRNFEGWYLALRFHYVRRWAGEGYDLQEKIYEFGPQVAFDFDGGSKTLGLSLTGYLMINPDISPDPFVPRFLRGRFFNVSLSLFFASRF